MKNPHIIETLSTLEQHVSDINSILEELHKHGVRIHFKIECDPPSYKTTVKISNAIQTIDYLK